MTTAVTAVPAVDPLADAARPPIGDLGTAAVGRVPAEQESADLRLVIEEIEGTGGFIYKTLDRATGEVIRQMPREEVLRLRADEAYAAGDVYDGKA